jgi:hypothetical protein
VPDLFHDGPVRYDLRDQLRCVNRELKMRKFVYPKRVTSGVLKQEKADQEIDCMEAVRDTLMELIAPKS